MKQFYFFLNVCYNFDNNKINTKNLDNIGGNIGNKYISYVIFKILFGFVPEKIDGITNLFSANLETIDVNYINNNYSCIILNLQDQLRTNISYYANTAKLFFSINNFIKKLNLPFVVFGLGSNCFVKDKFNDIVSTLHNEQLEFLKILSNKSKLISIRGKFTKKIFDDLNIHNYSMVGCPTFYLNNNLLLEKKKNLKKIVLSGAFIDNESIIKRFKIDNNYDVYYFLQDYNDYELVEKNNSKNNKKYFFSFNIDEINKFFSDKDFVIGTRVHCSIMAINNNVIPCCASGDSRAIEMCDLYKIPHLCNYTSFDNILDLYKKININDLNKNYKVLKNEFNKFLELNDIK